MSTSWYPSWYSRRWTVSNTKLHLAQKCGVYRIPDYIDGIKVISFTACLLNRKWPYGTSLKCLWMQLLADVNCHHDQGYVERQTGNSGDKIDKRHYSGM